MQNGGKNQRVLTNEGGGVHGGKSKILKFRYRIWKRHSAKIFQDVSACPMDLASLPRFQSTASSQLFR